MPRIVWMVRRYDPIIPVGICVMMMALYVAVFIKRPTWPEYWAAWVAGGFLFGQAIVWMSYLSYPVEDRELRRMLLGARRRVPWWHYALAVLGVGLALAGSGLPVGLHLVATMGVLLGFLAGAPWLWRKWRLLKEAYCRVLASPMEPPWQEPEHLNPQ